MSETKIKNIKTVFIADKNVRNYYGIYYDGINYSQLKYFIKKYKFNENIIKNLNVNSKKILEKSIYYWYMY